MKGDFTRRTFRPEKHYSSVRMQQGRVQVDADWNEQVEIQQHLARRQAADIIGQNGVSRATPDAFRIQVNATNEITIGAGRIYVDGILCELDTQVKFTEQPDLPGATVDVDANGRALVFLDVTERHVTALEDPEIVEVALGGADTATRTQMIAQVKLLKLEANEDAEAVVLEDRFVDTRGGMILAKVDPGGVPAGNQLYRVEIHDGGKDDASPVATFKWSRDNASAVAEWTTGTNPVEVNGFGRVHFTQGEFVELTDDTHELSGRPGVLRKIAAVVNGAGSQLLTLEEPDPTKPALPGLLAEFQDDNKSRKKKARRWDSDAIPLQVSRDITHLNFISLPGGGVSVAFLGEDVKPYSTRDAWLIPVRPGGIETVPFKINDLITLPAVLSAEEPRRYAKLAVIAKDGTGKLSVVDDLRERFHSLASLTREMNELLEASNIVREKFLYALTPILPSQVIFTFSGLRAETINVATWASILVMRHESKEFTYIFDAHNKNASVLTVGARFGAVPKTGPYTFKDIPFTAESIGFGFPSSAAYEHEGGFAVVLAGQFDLDTHIQFCVVSLCTLRTPSSATEPVIDVAGQLFQALPTITQVSGHAGLHNAGGHHLFILQETGTPHRAMLRVSFTKTGTVDLAKIDPGPVLTVATYTVTKASETTHRLVTLESRRVLVFKVNEQGQLEPNPLEVLHSLSDNLGSLADNIGYAAGCFDGKYHHIYILRRVDFSSRICELVEVWFTDSPKDQVSVRVIEKFDNPAWVFAQGGPTLSAQFVFVGLIRGGSLQIAEIRLPPCGR